MPRGLNARKLKIENGKAMYNRGKNRNAALRNESFPRLYKTETQTAVIGINRANSQKRAASNP